VKKQRLVGAMFHGRRSLPAAVPPMQPASGVRLLVGIILAALLTWLVARAFQPF
jgi:hypothetical protein